MHTLDVIPNKSQYNVGEKEIQIECLLSNSADFAGGLHCEWEIVAVNKVVSRGDGYWDGVDSFKFNVDDDMVTGVPGGYGVFVRAAHTDGRIMRGETAFDVVHHWRDAPRYGFLSDFNPEELGRLDDAEFLRRMHINIVQFYDWMYRHDDLLAGQNEFVDPLGRRLSHTVVREKINALRLRGMFPIAYAAVYASLWDYAEGHPDEVLYQNNGHPHSLAKLLYIMDISVDSKWTQHILQEFRKAILEMGFEGLHLDQYGMPKQAIRKTENGREVVKLNKLYPEFIDFVRANLGEETGIIFNNVSNYPTHTTAKAKQDIIYIEVWDPVSRFGDLKRIILDAKKFSDKQVVLAAYLPAFHPEHPTNQHEAEIGAILTMATIFASGGYHLLVGESAKVLADPYYPKYGKPSSHFQQVLQRYYDYIVMYRDVLFSPEFTDVSMSCTGGINTEVMFHKDNIEFSPNETIGSVWTFVKEQDNTLVLQLINLVGVDNDNWHEAKQNEPIAVEDIEVSVELWQAIRGVYWASPDNDTILSEKLQYEVIPRGKEGGDYIRFKIPRLKYWSSVYIDMYSGLPIDLKNTI